ncbi:MAG TPA: class I SAM-dependent methyltransferase [Oceanobacillus sp.]|nr:class I SAM-dependent methyltransferase [Oceanobacillus sp.]
MASDSVSFDRAVEYYDQTRGFPPGVDAEVAKAFVQAGNLTQTSRVLEIGVGTGRIALPLARHVKAYFGIDLSGKMLGKLREKQTDEPLYVVIGDATHLQFDTGTFDAVVAVHVFHLIPNWRDALAEVARVLKPQGLLLHGGGRGSGTDRLNELWRQAIKAQRHGPFPRGETEAFIEHAGWSRVGEAVHRYSDAKSPQQFLDSIRNRLWSSCWSMSDEELDAGYQTMLAYVREHYPDPTQPVVNEYTFHIGAYRRPNP